MRTLKIGLLIFAALTGPVTFGLYIVPETYRIEYALDIGFESAFAIRYAGILAVQLICYYGIWQYWRWQAKRTCSR